MDIENNLYPEWVHLDDIPEGRDCLQFIAKHGVLLGNRVEQLGGDLEFEVPIHLSAAITIGPCKVGAFSYIGAGSEIRRASIGRFCSIAANVAIGPAEHPIDWVSSHPFQFDGLRYFDAYPEWNVFSYKKERFKGNSAYTKIGNDVWIGRNAIIRQGVSVGDGAIIAAGAFVNKDVPPYAIVGGSPAKLIKYRFSPEIIENLLTLKWWDYALNPEKHDLCYSNPVKFFTQVSALIDHNLLDSFKPMRKKIINKDGKYLLYILKNM